jgi:hypothetical protein
MMVNNSTISSKAKNLLSPQLIEYNKKTTTYDIGNPSPDLGLIEQRASPFWKLFNYGCGNQNNYQLRYYVVAIMSSPECIS